MPAAPAGELSLARVEQELRVLGEYINRLRDNKPATARGQRVRQAAINSAYGRLRELQRRRQIIVERIEGRRAS